MFRTMYDPSVGPTPRNAFNVQDPKLRMEAYMTPIGVYVKVLTPLIDPLTKESFQPEHLIPFANIQSIKLEAEQVVEEEKPKTKVKAS